MMVTGEDLRQTYYDYVTYDAPHVAGGGARRGAHVTYFAGRRQVIEISFRIFFWWEISQMFWAPKRPAAQWFLLARRLIIAAQDARIVRLGWRTCVSVPICTCANNGPREDDVVSRRNVYARAPSRITLTIASTMIYAPKNK